MYSTLCELEAAIFTLCQAGGIAETIIKSFFATHGISLEPIKSGVWVFLWLKSAPVNSAITERDIPGFGHVLNLETHGGMLNRQLTEEIIKECNKLNYGDRNKYESVVDWADKSDPEDLPGELNEAAATISDWARGNHAFLDVAMINYLASINKISKDDIATLIYYEDILDDSLKGTAFEHEPEQFAPDHPRSYINSNSLFVAANS